MEKAGEKPANVLGNRDGPEQAGFFILKKLKKYF